MSRFLLTTIASFLLTLTGCALTGPLSIRSGRSVYNDAIVATNNEQVLAMIVKTRYQEPSQLLAVASVTANVSVQANAVAQWGIWAKSTFEGNLVPLSPGFAYEENPTIAYTPVQGPDYLRQLLGPIPLDLTVLVLGAARHAPPVWMLLVRNINSLENPDFLATPQDRPDERFARIAMLLAVLDRRGELTWAEKSGDKQTFELVLNGAGPEYEKQVQELYSLVGLRAGQSYSTSGPAGDAWRGEARR